MKETNLYNEYYFTEYRHRAFRQGNMGTPSARHFIAYMKKGTAEIKSEGKTLYVDEGDVFYIPKGLPYYSFWHGEPDICFLSIGFDKFNINRRTAFALQKIDKKSGIVEKLSRIPLVDDDIDCRALALFYDALDCIIDRLEVSPDRIGDERAEQIRRCIWKNPTLPISEIAAMCSISEAYLYPLFRRVTGMTPNEYRQKTLCERAVRLLETTDKSVEKISAELGFSSSSYFRKVFKQHIGKSPKSVRRSFL